MRGITVRHALGFLVSVKSVYAPHTKKESHELASIVWPKRTLLARLQKQLFQSIQKKQQTSHHGHWTMNLIDKVVFFLVFKVEAGDRQPPMTSPIQTICVSASCRLQSC